MFEWIKKNIFELITALVALYGAILGTINLFTRKKKLKVFVKYEYNPPDYKEEDAMITIIPTNDGFRPITIDLPCFESPDGYDIVPKNPITDDNFPHELREGQSCKVKEYKRVFNNELFQKKYRGTIKLRAKVKDQSEKIYRSKRFKFTIEKPKVEPSFITTRDIKT